MKTTNKTLLWIGAGLSLALAAFTLRGLAPETYRYLRIRRM